MESKVPSQVPAVAFEGGRLRLELVEVDPEVGVGGVLGRDPQGELLSAPGDPERGMGVLQRLGAADGAIDHVVAAFEPSLVFGPHQLHDLDRLGELADPHCGPGELVAVGLVFALVPAGADPHLQPASRDHVDRSRHLGQVGRGAVGVAGAHLPEADGVGGRGQRRHQRPGLVGGLLGGLGNGVEMVVDPGRLIAGGLDRGGDGGHGRPVVGGLDADQVETPALRDEGSESQCVYAYIRLCVSTGGSALDRAGEQPTHEEALQERGTRSAGAASR